MGASVREFVLSLGADGESQGSAAARPISLREKGAAAPIAMGEFDTSPFVDAAGQQIDLATCLTADGLLDANQIKLVGEELWKRLTPGDVGVELGRVLQDSRIYLDLRADDLAAYPWELARTAGWSVFVEAHVCLGRLERESGGFPGTPPDPDHPLRVLVVVGNDPTDDRIGAGEELLAIEAAAHAQNDEVLLRTLIRPEPETIRQALVDFRPHVFHFIGHGYRPSPTVDPEIHVYSSNSELNEAWTADRVRTVVREAPPRLVVLNACLTAGAPTASTSLVRAFLDAGCIAVVAMMGEIRADASHEFSRSFYRALLSGKPVDDALAAARRAIMALAGGNGPHANLAALRSNWPLPRLTAWGDVETAVTMTRRTNAPPGRRYLKDDFVVRWDERWRVWRSIDGTTSRLAVLSGVEDVGKSELLNTVAQTCARHGEHVVLVDVGGPSTSMDWRDVLRAISTEADSVLPGNRLGEIAEAPEVSGNVINDVHAELERCAGAGGLLVVLDGLSDWLADLVDLTLLPELCSPYLAPSATSNVRMMIALRDSRSDVWTNRPPGWQPIELGCFEEDEWNRAITHLAAHWIDRVPKAKQARFREYADGFREDLSKDGSTLEFVRMMAMQLSRG